MSTLTADDIAAVLTKCAGYDSAHTPRASAILTGAWLEHFDTVTPYATRADLLAAVTEYHREPRDRMLQPGDLSTVIRGQRREVISRLGPDGYVRDTSGGDLPEYPEEWSSEERLAAYWYMIKTHTARPQTTANWHTLLRAARKVDE